MTSSLNILQLVSSEGFYGAESMLVSLSAALVELGHRPLIGVFHDERAPHTEVADVARDGGLPVRLIPCGGRWDWRSVQAIRRLVAENGTHVVHSHGYKADLYTFAAERSNRVAQVSTCHNWPSRLPLMKAYAALDRMVLRGFHRVSAPSAAVIDILRCSGVAKAKLAWIPNGIAVKRFRGAKPTLRGDLDPRHQVVGFAGRLVRGKGGAELLRAARQILAARANVTFVFTGEGPSRKEWQALAEELGIAANVRFTGCRDDMPGVYKSFDVLVLPSFDEAMPMCLLEGMAAGIPVVATRVGSVPDLVVPGETGFLLEAGDIGGLARSILHLLENPGLAADFGSRGQARVTAEYSSTAMARKYVDLYLEALAGRRERFVGA